MLPINYVSTLSTLVLSNYRGTAVGTVLSKLSAKVINSRSTNWAETNEMRAVGQAGFREDYMCVQ